MRTEIAAALTALLLFPLLSSAACIKDDTGTDVCLDSPPARVVSLYGAFTETLFRLDAGKTLAGRTKNDTTVPGTENVPIVGTGLKPDVELIMALKPDLVLARAGKAGAEALNALRGRGVKVAAFDPQSLAELYSATGRMGMLLGRETKAEEETAAMKAGLEAVRAKAARAASAPTVIFEVSAEPLMVAGSEGIVPELIVLAGGVNPVTVKKKLVRLDAEALLKADPDVYIVQTGPMNVNPAKPAERPFHSKLKAVAGGRVAVVDEKLFSRPGPNVAEAAKELLKILHPEL